MVITNEAVILDCTYSVINWWRLNGLYACTARIILVGDQRIVTDVSQNHQTGRRNSDVVYLAAFSQQLNYMLINLELFYENLHSINLNDNKITSITRDDLKGLKNLKQIYLGRNQIKIIEPNLFADNPLLMSISFQNNPLRHVAHHVFDHLPDLSSLRFQETTCINQGFDGERHNVLLLMFRLIISCPPSFEMTEQKIITGEDFHNKTDEQIVDRLSPVILNQRELGIKLTDLEIRMLLVESRCNLTDEV